MAIGNVDFDTKDSLDLVKNLYLQAERYQAARNEGYKRFYHQYHGYLNTINRDPNMSNIFIPKLYSSVETSMPRELNAAFGVRPYIPVGAAAREDYKDVAQCQTQFHDDILYKAGFLEKMIMAMKMKSIFGTSFIEAIPYFDQVVDKHIVQGLNGQPQVVDQPAVRYRLDVRVYAPWEVYVDPFAVNLSDLNGCRYVVMFQLASRRQILQMAERGAYGKDFDQEKLIHEDAVLKGTSHQASSHWGLQILADMGLSNVNTDNDIGILMRVMTPDRYIDSWNGTVLLRDVENPYTHKRINLSRMVHVPDPHTQNQFWGIGMAEMSEVLIDLENDLWDLTLDSHAQTNQPAIYYREDAVNPENLVKTAGNRIAVSSTVMADRNIKDIIHESPGTGLPPDHYRLPDVIDNKIDLVLGSHEVSRGEAVIGAETASEVAMLKEGDEARLSVSIAQIENTLADFGSKIFHHASQFATMDDFVEVLGQEKAMQMQFANPNDIPGGYNFQFKGKDKILNVRGKQRMVGELAPVLMNNPNVLPGALAKWIMETYEVPSSEIAEIVIPDQVMQEMAQEQEDQNQQIGTREDQSERRKQESQDKMKNAGRAQGVSKKSEHNTLQEGQNSAKNKRQDGTGGAV